MIIKACHYKNKAIYRSKAKVAYILQDKSRATNAIDSRTYLQNFTQTDPAKLHLDFLANNKFLKARKNGTVSYHFILSFSPKDTPNITDKMMMDILKKFVELRKLQDHIVLGKCHVEEAHRHIHIYASSNALRSTKPKRFTKAQFKKLLRDMETYQLEKYGKELSHSVVHVNKPLREKDNYIRRDQNKRREAEYQLKLRLGDNKLTNKEQAKKLLEEVLEKGNDFNSLVHTLKEHDDFELYSYRGKLKGVWYKQRKFTFKLLQLEVRKVRELDEVADRLRQLSLIRETFKRRSKNRGLER